jgi:hypothetical protein
LVDSSKRGEQPKALVNNYVPEVQTTRSTTNGSRNSEEPTSEGFEIPCVCQYISLSGGRENLNDSISSTSTTSGFGQKAISYMPMVDGME